MQSFVHITQFLTKYFDYSFNSLGNRDNNHKREVGEMEDAMKSLENKKNLDLKRKMDIITTLDGMKSTKVLFTLPILFLYIRVGYHLTVPQMETLSHK